MVSFPDFGDLERRRGGLERGDLSAAVGNG